MTLTARSGRCPSQMEGELRGFIALLMEEGVKRYLEVGAREGDTFYEVMHALGQDALGVALDLPGGAWGNRRTKHGLKDCISTLKHEGYKASCIFGDSQATGTLQIAQGRGPYDAILIDGDHRYEGVKADWENYQRMGRLIAFHDIVGFDQREKKENGAEVEVPRLWAEIKASGKRTQEFIDEGSKMGIGVVWMA